MKIEVTEKSFKGKRIVRTLNSVPAIRGYKKFKFTFIYGMFSYERCYYPKKQETPDYIELVFFFNQFESFNYQNFLDIINSLSAFSFNGFDLY